MVSLLRRREMVMASGGEAWDYEWDYTMGKPDANNWTLGKSGTTSQSITTDGLKLTTSTTSSYCYYRPPSPYNASSGVIEAVVRMNRSGQYTGSGQIRICFANGTKGCHVRAINNTNNQGLYLFNSDTLSESVRLADFSLNTFHTVRCVLDNGIGSVFLDGQLVGNNIDVTSLLYSSNTSFWWQGASTNSYAAIYKSVKVRVGRI